jgi:anti-sigma factor RsiW
MNEPCRDMQDKIADFVLGALDAGQARVVREHVGSCAACRECLRALEQQDRALGELGRTVEANMEARLDRAIGALEEATVVGGSVQPLRPWRSVVWRVAVAAVLILGVGITVGRLTATPPVDIEQLRADVQASVLASLESSIEANVLAQFDRRLATALAASDDRVKTEIADQLRRDLRAFGSQFLAESQAQMDVRLDEMVRLIEAARLADRQHAARAFEKVALNRQRDLAQIGRGFQTLAVMTDEVPTPASTTTNN